MAVNAGISPGRRVDTPFGLGRVRSVGFYPELLGGPYVLVDLEAKGMTIDDTALLAPEDIDPFDE